MGWTWALQLLGQPDMCVVAWTATVVNVLELNDVMTSKGWTVRSPTLHLSSRHSVWA